MPNKLTPQPPQYSSEGENSFCLLALVNPQTKYRSYTIAAADKMPQHYDKKIFGGTWQDCVRLRIAIGTDVKKGIYSTLQIEHLQTVFN